MQLKKLIKIIFLGFISLSVLSFFSQKEKILLNINDKKNIEQFDIILTSGQSVQSKLLNLLNSSIQDYSHVGIILKEKDEIFVLHSTPDGTGDNGIRYDNFQEFLNLSNVNYYRILRLDSVKDYKGLERSALNFKNSKIPFDYNFENVNKDKIYCSEMIFDIFNENELLKTKLDLSKPIHPKKFIEMTEFKTVKERKSITNKI